MIPYAILYGKVHSKDGMTVDVNVLELMGNGFTFRLLSGYREIHGDILKIDMYFFDWSVKQYRGVVIDFVRTTNSVSIKENTDFYDVYEIGVDDKEFISLSSMLTKQYINYIDCKLNLGDAEMSAQMTNYPAGADAVFASGYEEQIKEFAVNIMADNAALGVMSEIVADTECEMCYSLENRKLVDMYLSMHIDEFIMSVFKDNYLENHPFSNAKIKRIYIGNQYCTNLMIDIDTVFKIIDKAYEEGINVTLAIPPVSATKYAYVCEYIDKMLDYIAAKYGEMTDGFELCVNDLGMMDYAINKHDNVKVIEGILLNKYRRDPRMKYVADVIPMETGVVYYPYYQSNTGTFCPLCAVVKNGERGNQERVFVCGHECEKKVFLYPNHLNMIGKYNSLFGVSVNGIDSHNHRRVVINL